jgi:branched-chain amino acid aminotransferase
MTRSSGIVFFNGFFVAPEDAKVSIFDRGLAYGDGLFETMRSYSGRIFHLQWHLERLFLAAEQIFLEFPVTLNEMGHLVEETRRRNGLQDAVIRLTLTRGAASPGLSIPVDALPTLFIHAREFEPLPERYYQDGIGISLFPGTGFQIGAQTRSLKSCNYLSQILIRSAATKEGSFEGVCLDADKRVSEGTTTNLFIVKSGVLKTPALNRNVLPGITRRVVLDMAHRLKFPAQETELYEIDLMAADEIFLTNTGVEILPVTRVAKHKIASGRPGPVTRHLREQFTAYVDQFNK